MSMRCEMNSRSPKGTHFLRNEHSAFCVACGNATCSAACHDKYLQSPGLCTFAKNFQANEFETGELASQRNMRALTLMNIKFAEKENLSSGMPLNRTSRSFLFGMKHPEKNKIYLQRGFRQYGRIEVKLSGSHIKRI